MSTPKPRPRWVVGVVATTAACLTALGGSATYDFNSPPPADLQFVLSQADAGWRDSGGVNNSGYVALFDAVNGQYAAVMLPDFDNGLIVKGFTFEVDLRVGNATGNDGRPADGFSINYARASDPVVAQLAQEPPVDPRNEFSIPGAPEGGTLTGLSICFDTWSGNTWPSGETDIEGIILRVDNVTKARVPMPIRNGACDNAQSLQTGPYNPDLAGAPDELCWAPLKVDLAENGEVTVTWKGTVIVDKVQTGFTPSAGRIVLAGRTGGANENTHIDNLKITTIPAEKVLFTGVTSDPYGCIVTLDDAGPSVLDPATVVFKFDNLVIPNAQLQFSKAGTTTSIKYTAAALFAPGSQHRVDLEFKDTRGIAGTGTGTFTVTPYALIPASFAATGVNKNQPGFMMRPYGTEANNPNSLQWTEDQLAGKYGPNLADLSGADANGFYVRDTVINFDIGAGAGNFQQPDFPDDPFPGFPGSQSLDGGTGNATEEVFTYLEFPAAGVYVMGVNSDDGFKVSSAKNPRDKLGVVCGFFDGGRGAADTLFTIVIEQAGIYPFRLLWQNGGGGANLEWFTVRSGQKILINDTANPNAIKAYRTSSANPAYVSSVTPMPNATGVAADVIIKVDITRGAAAIDNGSVQMTLDGAPVTPNVATAGNVTTVSHPVATLLPPNSPHTVTLSFKDTAVPAVQYDYSWPFTVANYVTLPTALRSPLGSEDRSKPGINVKTWQLAARGNTQANNNEWAEGALAGLVDENVADLTGFVNGVYAETGTINYAHTADQANGNFTPDRQHPGIPGNTSAPTDNYQSEFLAYIAFDQPGFHTMGVNSDDNFRVTIAEQVGRQYLQVLAPAGIAGGMAAVATSSGMNVNPGFGGPLPTTPIEADAVVLGTSCLADPALPDLTGKIAVIIRGTCTFVEKCRNAQSKGALAVVICNQEANAGNFPIVMGGDGIDITIPVMMVDYDDGQKLINNANGLRLSIGKDTNFQVGEFNGNGRGASDTIFSFYVPQAGVYPFRCFYMQGGGGANVEWFTVTKDGAKVLLNDTATGALKTYRARTFVPTPTLAIGRQAGNVVITYTGTLQSADAITGPWTDVVGASSPYSTAPSAAQRYYRSRQ
jgi:hypothetical protein